MQNVDLILGWIAIPIMFLLFILALSLGGCAPKLQTEGFTGGPAIRYGAGPDLIQYETVIRVSMEDDILSKRDTVITALSIRKLPDGTFRILPKVGPYIYADDYTPIREIMPPESVRLKEIQ